MAFEFLSEAAAPLTSGLAASLVVALGCGLLIGLERERRKRRRGPAGARAAAGIRTFAIAALAGALAQGLAQPWLVALGAALIVALVVAAYRFGRRAAAGSPDDDPGLTTELALLVTYLVGVLAVPEPALAAAVAVVLATLLAGRERLHRFATTLVSEAELHDGLIIAALALVLLPLAPATPPAWLPGIAPRALLVLVLLILLLQGAGHVALRLLGPRAGLAVAGLASGFVSSTATIATFGAAARAEPATGRVRAAGAAFSALATWVQAVAMLLALAPAAARAFLPAALAGGAVTLAGALLVLRGTAAGVDQIEGRASEPGTSMRPRRAARSDRGPLRLREAALVALMLTLVALAVGWAQQTFGTAGRLVGTALAALADAHAAVAAQAALHAAGRIDARAAADAALLALAVNSASRAGVAFVAGGARYGAAVAGVLAAGIAAAGAAAFVLR